MNRLLAATVPVVAVALLAVALVAAQDATPEGNVGVFTNELGTPCAGLAPDGAATPAATPDASPAASPVASPGAIVLPGCPTDLTTPVAGGDEATPAGGAEPSE